jgi:mono/diheme cytochrome c family protein
MHGFWKSGGLGIGIVGAALILGSAAPAQQIKKEPVRASNPTSGAKMFRQYCAVCHGRDATGDGPAAKALKVAPPDLTTLAKRHNGKFPSLYVSNVLRNGVNTPAHGNEEMPVWGPLFSTMDSGSAVVHLRIANLTGYLRSLQKK